MLPVYISIQFFKCSYNFTRLNLYLWPYYFISLCLFVCLLIVGGYRDEPQEADRGRNHCVHMVPLPQFSRSTHLSTQTAYDQSECVNTSQRNQMINTIS